MNDPKHDAAWHGTETAHVRVPEEVVAWECIHGEFGHESDCPTVQVEACAGCTRPGAFEGDTYTAVVLWDTAEREGHWIHA